MKNRLIVSVIFLIGLTACDILVPQDQNVEFVSPESTQSLESGQTPNQGALSLDCLTEGGEVSEVDIPSSLLEQDLEFQIYLPPCYQEQGEQYYPLLILFHGQSFNQDQWPRLGITDTADRLIQEGQIVPLIIVMPRDRLWVEPEENLFGQAVLQELLPHLEANYRAIPSREYRAVGGLSWGAGWALHLGLRNPDIFGAVGAHSLALFNADANYITSIVEAIPREQLPRLYFDMGAEDRPSLYDSTIWLLSVLNLHRIPHEWHLNPGGHDEAYWAENVEAYLLFYADTW